MALRCLIISLLSVLGSVVVADPANWSRFRGSDGLGISEHSDPPVEFGPTKNVRWRTTLPSGHSSPVIWEDKIFLTGSDDEILETICLDTETGSILWRATAPMRSGKIPYFRRVNSAASPSPAVNQDIVCVYFDAFGLIAYDHEGKQLWKKQLPKSKQPWGVGASPIIVDGRVYLNVDQDIDSYLIAVNALSGEEVWRTERPTVRRGFSTPVVTNDRLIVAGSLRVTAYDLADGREVWSAKGLPYQVSPSPVVVDDTLYMAAWDLGGIGASFDSYLERFDADKSGTISKQEHNFQWDFPKFDRNKDNLVTREEFEDLENVFAASHDSLMAIRLGGSGDVTDSHVKWESTTSLPHIPSVLVYKDLVYTVRNGGIVCCYDAATGKRHYQDRLPAGGNYYASPVAVNGKVIFASEKGVVSVIKASADFDVLAKNVFDENIMATPAFYGDTMLIRSGGTLYAIGE